ncbi:hypothetical protein [Stutzerimonas chloritidismutans]|uniref:hypothetical protein n=1 Tax=Stutzerimonas chloritidismutans TaxID=203192 RepID=UPI003F17A279
MSRLPLILGAAVVVIAGGYFGLSAYSSSQADSLLEDWVYDHDLGNNLSWESVSSSPLGGRVTLNGVRAEFGKNDPQLYIEQLVISDRDISDERTRVRLQLEGVQADRSALGALNSLAGGFGLLRGFSPAVSSGLTDLEPFTLELYLDIDDDNGTLETDLSVGMPKLFDSRVSYRLSNLRDLNRTLRRLADELGEAKTPFGLTNPLGALASSVERAELGDTMVSLEDRGAAARSIALYQRYNTPLDPGAGDADAQRKAHYRKVVADTQKTCERESASFPAGFEDACELLGEAMLGEISGVRLTIEPKERIRLTDLMSLQDPSRQERMLERLNPQLDSL